MGHGEGYVFIMSDPEICCKEITMETQAGKPVKKTDGVGFIPGQ